MAEIELKAATDTTKPECNEIRLTHKYSCEEATFVTRSNKWFKKVGDQEIEVPPARWSEWGIPIAEPLVVYINADGRKKTEPPSAEAQFWQGINARITEAVGAEARSHFRRQLVFAIAYLLVTAINAHGNHVAQLQRHEQDNQMIGELNTIRRDMTTIALATSGELSQEHRAQMYEFISTRYFVVSTLLHINQYLCDINYIALNFYTDNLANDPVLPTTQGVVISNTQLANIIERDMSNYEYEEPVNNQADHLQTLERAIQDINNILARLDDDLDLGNFTLSQKNNMINWHNHWSQMLRTFLSRLTSHVNRIKARMPVGRSHVK